MLMCTKVKIQNVFKDCLFVFLPSNSLLMQIKQIKGNMTITLTWSPLDKVSKMKWLEFEGFGNI